MKLRIPYPPSTNDLYRSVIKGKGRFAVAVPVKTKAYREYEEVVRQLMLDSGHQRFELPTTVGVTLHVYRPRKAGDLSNRVKAAEDVLKGIVYADDSQVIEHHDYRHDNKDDPHISVEVWDVDEVPEESPLEPSAKDVEAREALEEGRQARLKKKKDRQLGRAKTTTATLSGEKAPLFMDTPAGQRTVDAINEGFRELDRRGEQAGRVKVSPASYPAPRLELADPPPPWED